MFLYPRLKSKSVQGGGIVILIKECFVNFVTSENCIFDTIVWLKIKKGVIRKDKDVYIACVYIPPARSNYYKQYNCDVFDELENSIEFYTPLGEVMIVGDTNSRTGVLDDFVRNDSVHHTVRNRLSDIFNYVQDTELVGRRNPDLNTNCYGSKLLSLCKATNLRILNGRHINGYANDFTYCGANGMSVIDYLILPTSLFPTVRQFIVSNLTTFSDHAFLHIQIQTLRNMDNNSDNDLQDREGVEYEQQDKFKWNDNYKQQCAECLRLNSDRIQLYHEVLILTVRYDSLTTRWPTLPVC